jgi:diguanylate cyclase (GGDEF)-like protein
MTETAVNSTEERTAYAEEVRRATHRSGLWGGVLTLVTLPFWAGFDLLVDPARAGLFVRMRLVDMVVVTVFWLLLVTRSGARHPAPLTLGYVVAVEILVAWMIPRAGREAAAYSLGMVFVIMAASSFMQWSWRWNVAQTLIAWLALVLGMVFAPASLTESQVGSIAFFIVSSSMIAVVGQCLGERTNRREFAARYALVLEQARTRDLVAQLQRRSVEDALTGLTNRRGWNEALAREIEHAARHGAPLTILLCDLDGLKSVNDTMGHPTGDRVLCSAAGALLAGVGAGDVVARLGGDEFAVLCPVMRPADAARLAERLRLALGDLDLPELSPEQVTVSIGVAGLDGPGDTAAQLMSRADTRLYLAKRHKNAVAFGDGSADAPPGSHADARGLPQPRMAPWG